MFKVSKGNSKLGRIYNINLPAIVTCAPDAPCKKVCYANKGNYCFKSVKSCYAENLQTFLDNPLQAENDILMQLPHVESDLFTLYTRIHSSGDFVNMEYLHMIISICNKRPYMKFLAFTKKYDLINEYLINYGELPENLTIVYSHWQGYNMDNKWFNMPIAMVKEYSDVDIQDDAIACTGHCETCYKCWYMTSGQQVVFNKH